MFSLKSFVLVFCGFTQRYVKYSVPLKKLQLNCLFEIKVVTARNLTQFKILCIWRPMIFAEERRTTNPKDIHTSSSIIVRFAIDHHLRPDVDDVTKRRLSAERFYGSDVDIRSPHQLVRVEEPVALDLDSRIELLLKGKISAALNTPAFLQLQLDGSSNSGSSRSSSRAADHVKNVDQSHLAPVHFLLPSYLNKSI